MTNTTINIKNGLFIQNWLLVNAIMGLAPSLHLKAIPPLVSSILQLDAFLLSSISSCWLHELGTRGRRKLGHRAELATRANGFLVEVHCVVVVGFCSRLFRSRLLWARDFCTKIDFCTKMDFCTKIDLKLFL